MLAWRVTCVCCMSNYSIDCDPASRSDQRVYADFHLCRDGLCRPKRSSPPFPFRPPPLPPISTWSVWCCSTFLQRTSAAVPTGFVVFIVAWVMLLVVAFGFPFSTNYSKGFVALFSLFPWTVLGKGIRDLAAATTGDSTHTHTCVQL